MAKIYAPPQTIKTSYEPFNGNINNLSYLKTASTIEQYSQKARYDGGEEFWVTTINTNGTLGYNANATQRILSIGSGATDKLGTPDIWALVITCDVADVIVNTAVTKFVEEV